MESDKDTNTVSEDGLSLEMITSVTSEEKDDKVALLSEVDVTLYSNQGHSQNSLPVEHSSTVGGGLKNSGDNFLQVKSEYPSIVPNDAMINDLVPIVSGGVVQDNFLLSPTSGKMEKVEAVPESELNLFSHTGAAADVGSIACNEIVWDENVFQQTGGLTSSTTTSVVEHVDLSNHYDDCNKNLHNTVDQDYLREDMDDSTAIVRDEYVVSANDNTASNTRQMGDSLTITLKDCLTASNRFSCDKCSKTFEHVTELSKHVNSFHGKRKRGRPSCKQSTEMYTSNSTNPSSDVPNFLIGSDSLKDVEVEDLYETLLKLRDIVTNMDGPMTLRKMDLSTLTEIFHLASKLKKLSDSLLETHTTVMNTNELNNADSKISPSTCSPFNVNESLNVNVLHHGLDGVASSIKYETIDNDSDYEFEGDHPQSKTKEDSWCRKSTRHRVVSKKMKCLRDSHNNDTQVKTYKSANEEHPERHGCHICQRVFVLKKHLDRHLLSHIGDRPYKCYKCDKTFKYKGRLITHLMTMHHDCEIPSEIRMENTITKLMPSLDSVKNEECQDMPGTTCQIASDNNSNAYSQALTENHVEIENDDENNADTLALTESGLEIKSDKQYDIEHNQVKTEVQMEKENSEETQVETEKQDETLDEMRATKIECYVCLKSFARHSGLATHMKTHTGFYENRPYKCQECDQSFMRRDHLVKHLAFIHPGCRIQSEWRPGFKCKLCSAEYQRRDKLVRHMKQKHPGVEIQIDEEKHFECDICLRRFANGQNVTRHKESQHGGVHSLKCTKCSHKAKTFHLLMQHCIQYHPPNELYQCNHCDRKFSTKQALTSHMETHAIQRKCGRCDLVCNSEGDFKKHYLLIHKNFTTCRHCPDFKATDKNEYLRHMRRHRERKQLCCELCGFSCTSQKSFRYHQVRHVNRTPFKCTECNYTCSSSTSFNNHKLKHAGLKPYLCTYCGKSFRDTTHLKQHTLIHLGTKPHKCKLCNYSTSSTHNLKEHEMTHTGEKPFPCSYCSFACRRRKALAHHIKVKHNINGTENTPLTDDQQDSSVPSDSKVDTSLQSPSSTTQQGSSSTLPKQEPSATLSSQFIPSSLDQSAPSDSKVDGFLQSPSSTTQEGSSSTSPKLEPSTELSS